MNDQNTFCKGTPQAFIFQTIQKCLEAPMILSGMRLFHLLFPHLSTGGNGDRKVVFHLSFLSLSQRIKPRKRGWKRWNKLHFPTLNRFPPNLSFLMLFYYIGGGELERDVKKMFTSLSSRKESWREGKVVIKTSFLLFLSLSLVTLRGKKSRKEHMRKLWKERVKKNLSQRRKFCL